MTAFVTGGSASGKSAYAERLAQELAAATGTTLVYLATLDPHAGGDTGARIARHRRARAGKGFRTVELAPAPGGFRLYDADARTPRTLDEIFPATGARAVVLLEDVGNLVANALFPRPTESTPPENPTMLLDSAEFSSTAESAAAGILAFLDALRARAAGLVAVSNEIFLEPLDCTDAGMDAYAQTLAAVNRALAARADRRAFVVAGIPVAF